MKQYIIVLLIVAASNIYSQCTDCKKNISTNPTNPINNCWNSGGDHAYKNKWDWRKKTNTDFDDWEMNPSMPWQNASPTHKMQSPFSINGTLSSEFNYLNLLNNANPDIRSYDFHPADGWELMKYEMGYFPNLNPLHLTNTNNIPFSNAPQTLDVNFIPHIILYNKYRGVVRVFLNVLKDNITQYNGLRVRLFLDGANDFGNGAGIFRHLEGYDRPLDQKTNVSSLEAIVPVPSGRTDWTSVDFQLGYDPCVCHLPSSLRLSVFSENNSDLVISARTLELNNEDMFTTVGGKKVFKYNNDYLTNFSHKTGGGSETSAGSVIYKSMDKKLDEYITDLNKYKSDLANYNNDKSNAAVLKYLAAGAKTAAAFFPKAYILKGSGEALSYAHDFISSSLTKPTPVNMPTMTLAATEMKGTISHTTPFSLRPFFQPGSYPQAYATPPAISYQNIPIYNEPVGLFALKKLPNYFIQYKKEHDRRINYLDDWRTSVGAALWCGTGYHQKYEFWDDVVYKPAIVPEGDGNLEYVFNPSADIDESKTKIKIAYEWEFENNEVSTKVPNNQDLGGGRFYIQEVDDYTNREFIPIRNAEVLFGVDLFKDRSRKNFTITSTFLPYESSKNDRYSGFEFYWSKYTRFYTNKFGVCLTYNSNYGPKDRRIFNSDPYLKEDNFNNPLKLKKVNLKVLVNFVFKTAGSYGLQNETQQLFTYNLYTDGVSSPIPQSAGIIHGPAFDATAKYIKMVYNSTATVYLDDLVQTLLATSTTSSTTNPIGLYGGTIFEKAKSIKFDNANKIVRIYCSEVSISGTGRLLKKAGDQFRYIFIAVNNTSDISISTFEGETDEVTDYDLITKRTVSSSAPHTKADCQNPSVYNANKLTLKAAQIAASYEKEIKETTDDRLTTFTLQPNPASDYTKLVIDQPVGDKAMVKVYDMVGREVYSQEMLELDKGKTSLEISTQELHRGIYIVKVIHGELEQSLKLEVTK